MTKKKFDINHWINISEPTIDRRSNSSLNLEPVPNLIREEVSAGRRGNANPGSQGDIEIPVQNDVEVIIQRLEVSQTDITTNYADWRDIGFAFASEFDESGRNYFHRVSRFYPDYSYAVCDKQYNNCLKALGHGVTIKTFFHLARQSGIDIAVYGSNFSPQGEMAGSQRGISSPNLGEVPVHRGRSQQQDHLPLIPDPVYNDLPEILQDVCNISQSDDERDILLLGAIATMSSCIPQIYGIYGGQKVYSNLYLFVTAIASAGKGLLTHCKRLVYPIHKKLREESQLLKTEYDTEMNIYNANKKKSPDMERPQKPPEKLLYIPANSSATGVFQLLSDNDGKGLIFETEGDTLAITFKSDYGNYSDGFRKAFHHETISYYRRTDREHVEIEYPQLSAVLSGTPKQLVNLIPDAENGLFSRFMFYYLNMKSEWKDVFTRPVDNGLENYFNDIGYRFYELFKVLTTNLEIEFNLTVQQQNTFNKQFTKWQDFYEKLLGNEYNATVRRLGLITFRMAMIFTALRILETGEIQRPLICEERDFNNAISITEILIQHAQKVYSDLPSPENIPKRENREQRFYSQLPETFSRQDYLGVAKELDIPDKTAQGYIAKFDKKGLIHRDKKDSYIKTQIKETKD